MLNPFKELEKGALDLYKRIFLVSIIIAPFLNRYSVSLVNLLIACLLGFFVGILICGFHYELFYKGKRFDFGFSSVNKLAFSLATSVIVVDAIGRAFMVGMMKMHWVLHLIFMAFVYLFLGAVIIAECTRNSFPALKLFIHFLIRLFAIRAILLVLATKMFTVPLSYSYILLVLSNVIGFVLLIPGAIVAYKNRAYFLEKRGRTI